MQQLDINGVKLSLRCKNCLIEKWYLAYKCTDCKLSQFEGFS